MTTSPRPSSDRTPSPGKWPRSRRSIGIGIAVCIAILVGVLLLIFQYQGDITQLQSALPFDLFQSAPDTENPNPSPSGNPRAQEPNIAVTIQHTAGDSFAPKIISITPTASNPSTYNRPKQGQPYSTLQLAALGGGVVNETRFTIATQGLFEAPETEPAIQDLATSTTRIVLERPHTNIAHAMLVSSNGSIFDQQSIPQELQQTPQSAQAPLLRRIARLLGLHQVRAQESSMIRLVVINEQKDGLDSDGDPAAEAPWDGADDVPALLNQIAIKLRNMVDTVEPWRTYKDRVQIIEVHNADVDMNCTTKEVILGAFPYPNCSDDAAVISTTEDKLEALTGSRDWDGIIVLHNTSCNCGSVQTSYPPIATVGRLADERLLVHELGHALGHMTDEYGYLYGGFSETGPNCFASQEACHAGTAIFPGAICSLGCSQPTEWRPATQIMHNTFIPLQFGAYEQCLMGVELANILGEEVADGICVTGEANDGGGGSYWGGGR